MGCIVLSLLLITEKKGKAFVVGLIIYGQPQNMYLKATFQILVTSEKADTVKVRKAALCEKIATWY
jgi:hypothetical protein